MTSNWLRYGHRAPHLREAIDFLVIDLQQRESELLSVMLAHSLALTAIGQTESLAEAQKIASAALKKSVTV